jgi:hypothetical protein
LTRFSLAAYKTGGRHQGKFSVCVWQVVSVHPDSVRNTFSYLNQVGHCPHLIWDPVSGDMVFASTPYQAGSLFTPEINRAGHPLFQIAVLGDREKPFTDTPLEGSEIVFKTLKRLGVPPVWPKGPPSLSGHSTAVFSGIPAAGHYSVDQLDAAFLGTGPIDIGRLMYDEPLPFEIDVPDGDEDIDQNPDWYPDWDDES